MTKPYWERCSRGKLLKRVMAEALPDNVVILTKASEQEARVRLIGELKAYCTARCGGCPISDAVNVPPEQVIPAP